MAGLLLNKKNQHYSLSKGEFHPTVFKIIPSEKNKQLIGAGTDGAKMRCADGWTSEEFGGEEYGQNISFEFSINKKIF